MSRRGTVSGFCGAGASDATAVMHRAALIDAMAQDRDTATRSADQLDCCIDVERSFLPPVGVQRSLPYASRQREL